MNKWLVEYWASGRWNILVRDYRTRAEARQTANTWGTLMDRKKTRVRRE